MCKAKFSNSISFSKILLTVIKPAFIALLMGQFVVSCGGSTTNNLNGNGGTSSNIAPIAQAGSDKSEIMGSVITLDASNSSDVDGDNLTYSWSFSSLPLGSNAMIINAATVNSYFTPDIAGDYVIALIVNDGKVESEPDTVTVTITNVSSNTPPIANAGSDQATSTGEHVLLDGSASSDKENDTLSYHWSFSSIPQGSGALLVNASTFNPSFTPDLDGNYIVELIVNDGEKNSDEDVVTISSSTVAVTKNNYAIVDTNQTSCYGSDNDKSTIACSNAGEDGSYSGNQASYTLSISGETVIDNVTGLIWTQTPDIDASGEINVSDKLTPENAVYYCENLILEGRSDWRLPTIKEQYSLMQFSGKDPSGYSGDDSSALTPFLDDSIFGVGFGDTGSGERIIDGQYASTSIYTATTMNGNETMFGVNFVDGRIKGYPTHSNFYVFCVTGNTNYGENELTDNGNSTISDSATGLMWQQEDYHSSNWQDAINYCEASTTGLHNDWRLPNVKELQSIVDYSRSPIATNSAAIDPIFSAASFINEGGDDDWGSYWSSTTHVTYNDYGTSAAYVSFGESLGYFSGIVQDVHGAGAQRSDNKVSPNHVAGASTLNLGNGNFYYHGPQGDILRSDNYVRCVRNF